MVFASYAHEEMAEAPDKHCAGSNDAKGSGSRMATLVAIFNSASSAAEVCCATTVGRSSCVGVSGT